MTDAHFDMLLQRALEQHMDTVATSLLAQTQDKAYSCSKRHQKRMAKMKADPLSYGRKHRFPLWQRALRQAALLLITLGLSGAILLSIPQVRAAVQGFIQYIYETYAKYVFTAVPQEDPIQLATLEAGWLPDGYEETYVRNTGATVLLKYQNEAGETIALHYYATLQGVALLIDNEHYTEHTLQKNGINYTYFTGDASFPDLILTWFSADASVYYHLDGPCTLDTLLKIAENLK